MHIYIYIYIHASLETYQGYSSHLQKHIPAKYLKNLSMKFIFLGKDFIL